MTSTMSFVLLPGLWHGAWSWLPVASRLRAAGHDAVALTVPGMSGCSDDKNVTPDDVAGFVLDEVVRRDLQGVVLVGHSWGGHLASVVSQLLPERVSCALYVNAIVPLPGAAVYEDNPEACDALLSRPDLTSDGMVHLGLSEVQSLLLPDASADVQQFVADLLVPAPTSFLTSSIAAFTGTGCLDVPVAYVMSEDDRTLLRPGTEMAQRLGVSPIIAGRGHESPITEPDVISAALLDAASELTLSARSVPVA